MGRAPAGLPGKPAPKLLLELFGGPVLSRRDSVVRISPFQACLLSVAFACGPDRIPRATVQKLLWDHHEDPSIRHRLSQLVYQVNQNCGTRIVELDKEYLRVNCREASCDLDDLDAMISAGRFPQAHALIDRGFLSALTAKRTSALSDWIAEHRQRQRDHLRAATLAHWHEAELTHDWATARATAEVLLRMNPGEEADLRRVMRASAMSGSVREAEATYRAFAERAAPAGDWEPEPATARLLEDVRVSDLAPPGNPAGNQDPWSDLDLVGRSDTLARLCRSIYRKLPGRPWKTVALVGAEGVGKTRIVREALKGATLKGYRLITASAAELESDIPLNLLLEPLSQPWVGPLILNLPDPWKTVLFSLLPKFQEDGPFRTTRHLPTLETLPRQTCEALLELFTSVAESRKTILFLDNFHWTDPATLTVLQFLTRRWRAGDFTLILALRPEELHRRGTARCESDILDFDRTAKVIHLRRLDDASARRLATAVARRDLTDSAMGRIVRLSGGNPRFLVELAAASPIKTSLRHHRELFLAPPSIRQALERRMRSVTGHSKNVVSCLAVVGGRVTLAELMRITNSTRDDCADALEDLQALRLLDWSDAAIGLRHEIVGTILYDRISPARRLLLHARVAETLHDRHVRSRVNLIALHHFWAGNHDLAHLYATEAVRTTPASDIATRLRFLALARDASVGVRRSRAALSLARLNHTCNRLQAALACAKETLRQSDGLSEGETAELRFIAADAGHRLGLADTRTTLKQFAAIEASSLAGRHEHLCAVVLDATVKLLDRAGDREGVREQLGRIRSLGPMSDPAARARIFAALATATSHRAPADGIRHARRAVEAARKGAPADEVALALQRLAVALMATGRLGTEDGWRSLNEARRACDESGHHGALALVLLHLADWQTAVGDHETAGATLAEATPVVAEMDCPETRGLEALVRGNLGLGTGSVEVVRRELGRAHDIAAGKREGRAAAPPIPDRLIGALHGLEGNMLLESGKLGLASQVEERAPLPDSLEGAPLGLVLFHSRLSSRKGDAPAALNLLARAIAANEPARPMVWLPLALEAVRLARRSGTPLPALANKARAEAARLGLPGLAQEFLPFCER